MGQKWEFYFIKKKIDVRDLVEQLHLRDSHSEHWQRFYYENNGTPMDIITEKNKIIVRCSDTVLPEFLKGYINGIKNIYKVVKVGGFGVNEYDGFNKGDETEEFPIKTPLEKISRIWSVNLFTPQEVKKYNRKKILSSPCEFIEEWEDGSIFIMIKKDRFSSTLKEREKLRIHLNAK